MFNTLSYLCQTRKETGCGLLVLAYKHLRVFLKATDISGTHGTVEQLMGVTGAFNSHYAV